MSQKTSLRDVVIFTIKLIAPTREDLILALLSGKNPDISALHQSGNRVVNSLSRAEHLAREFHRIQAMPDGSEKKDKENELLSAILGTHLPLHYPECMSMSRLLELRHKVEEISMKFVTGELTLEQYKAALHGDKK